jgi:hypothetical protein
VRTTRTGNFVRSHRSRPYEYLLSTSYNEKKPLAKTKKWPLITNNTQSLGYISLGYPNVCLWIPTELHNCILTWTYIISEYLFLRKFPLETLRSIQICQYIPMHTFDIRFNKSITPNLSLRMLTEILNVLIDVCFI